MSIVQVQGGGGRIVSDRTSFVGVRIPTEIKVMIKAVNKLDKDIFRRLLKCMSILYNNIVPKSKVFIFNAVVKTVMHW